ncbi:MAG TPA: protease modulator HflC [Sphingomicrobium sp.]|nr:protease modulator HflC [Sphingomicrobium sp.]
MTDFIRRHPLASGIAAFILLVVFLTSFPIVPETKQAVVVRFGKPVRILNEYEAGRPIGGAGAGISWRIPFAEQVVWIDKRIQDVDMQQQQVLSTDQRRLEVDAFARYRIVNPLLMYVRARTEEQLAEQLRPILGSEVRNELGKVSFASLLTPERQGVMEDVRDSLNRIAGQYGVKIIDVRIKRTDLPDGTPLQSAFERMRTAREQEARSIRAEGAKQAQIIRAQADADAARTYAASFGKDPQFYDFYRAMQSYESTFLGDGSERPAPTTVILSPQNDYLREFTGKSR